MKFSESLKKNQDFQIVYKTGRSVVDSMSVMYVLANDEKNIKITKSFFKGLAFTLLQLIVYAPLSIVGLIALIGILGAASQARPVYRIDD